MGHMGGVKDEKEEKDKKEEKEEKEEIKEEEDHRKGEKKENQRKTKTTQKIEERETESREEGRELFGHFKYRNPSCSKTISGSFTLVFLLSVDFLFCCEYRFSNGFMFRISEIYNFSYELNSF